MTFGALATLIVAIAFVALIIWVLLPRNRTRLERHGRIPLEPDDTKKGR